MFCYNVRHKENGKTKMYKSLLAALALLPVVAIGGEQVILEKDFNGFAMRKTRYVDGWSLLSYAPGELSREKGTLKLKALSANGKDWGRMLCAFRNGNLTGSERIMLDLGNVKNFAEVTVKLTLSMSGGKTPHEEFKMPHIQKT